MTAGKKAFSDRGRRCETVLFSWKGELQGEKKIRAE